MKEACMINFVERALRGGSSNSFNCSIDALKATFHSQVDAIAVAFRHWTKGAIQIRCHNQVKRPLKTICLGTPKIDS